MKPCGIHERDSRQANRLLLIALFSATLSVTVAARLASMAQNPPVRMQEVAYTWSASPLYRSTTESASTVMSEAFEASWPALGWTLQDLSTTDGGEFLWGKRNCQPHLGSFGGWCIGGGVQGSLNACSAQYPNNLHTLAVYGPVTLGGSSAASLTFHMWGRTEHSTSCIYDFFFAGSSVDGTNFLGTKFCGDYSNGSDGNGYHREVLDLGNRLGQNQVWIAFAFQSDFSVTDIGITVDDIILDVNSSTGRRVYLPLVMKAGPLVPDTPVLNAIANADGDGDYTVSWNAASRADSYTLEEDGNGSFVSPIQRYSGSALSWNATGKAIGSYYYRVKANNSSGSSAWSTVQSVSVIHGPSKIYAKEDAFVLQALGGFNYGSYPQMWVGYQYIAGCPNPAAPANMKTARSLIKFDISSIQAGTPIAQARLSVFMDVVCNAFASGSRDITVYRIVNGWSESSVTWNTQPTWAEVSGSITVPLGGASGKWYSIDVTNLVRSWVNGNVPNDGLVLIGPENTMDGYVLFSFSTRHGSAAYAPYLDIVYVGTGSADRQ